MVTRGKSRSKCTRSKRKKRQTRRGFKKGKRSSKRRNRSRSSKRRKIKRGLKGQRGGKSIVNILQGAPFGNDITDAGFGIANGITNIINTWGGNEAVPSSSITDQPI